MEELTVHLGRLRLHRAMLEEERSAADRLLQELSACMQAARLSGDPKKQKSLADAYDRAGAVRRSIGRRIDFLDDLQVRMERLSVQTEEIVFDLRRSQKHG